MINSDVLNELILAECSFDVVRQRVRVVDVLRLSRAPTKRSDRVSRIRVVDAASIRIWSCRNSDINKNVSM